MTESLANRAQTTLTVGITDTAPTIDVASAAGFPSTGDYRIRIGNEYMLVTGGQGTTTWTVKRAVEDASRFPAAAHIAGDAVKHVMTAAGIGQVISDSVAATKLDALATPDDTTDLDATSTEHGLLPKLSGNASDYLDGSGAWSTPAGGGGGDWETVVAGINGKVHRWKFDESSGYPQDSIGSLHMTTGGGTITRQVASPLGDGMTMTAVMNGSGNGNAPMSNSTRSIVAVFRDPTASTGTHLALVEYGPTGTTRQWCHACTNHDGIMQVGFLFWSDDHKPGHSATDNTWHIGVFRYRNRAVSIVVDGMHIYSGATGATLGTVNSGNLKLGAASTIDLTDVFITGSWILNADVRKLCDAFLAAL